MHNEQMVLPKYYSFMKQSLFVLVRFFTNSCPYDVTPVVSFLIVYVILCGTQNNGYNLIKKGKMVIEGKRISS